MPLTSDPLSSMAAALALVLGLVLLGGRAARFLEGLRGRPGGVRGRRLGVQDTLVLDRVRRLHIVRCDGRELVLLTGGPTDLVAGWLPAPRAEAGGAGS